MALIAALLPSRGFWACRHTLARQPSILVTELQDMQAYNGQVAKDIDHEALMPAAWRLDKYLDADVDADEDFSLDALRGHRLKYDKSRPGDDMARNDNIDNLTVCTSTAKNPRLHLHSFGKDELLLSRYQFGVVLQSAGVGRIISDTVAAQEGEADSRHEASDVAAVPHRWRILWRCGGTAKGRRITR